MLKILLVVLVVAIAIYAVTRMMERRGEAPRPRPRQAPPQVLGPDDDPEFLRRLERERRRREKDEPDSA